MASTIRLGFTPFPEDAPQPVILREAINIPSRAGRSELYALMRLGQGALAARQWHRGLVEAEHLGDETVSAALIEDPDLHHRLMKGVYETNLAPCATSVACQPGLASKRNFVCAREFRRVALSS